MDSSSSSYKLRTSFLRVYEDYGFIGGSRDLLGFLFLLEKGAVEREGGGIRGVSEGERGHLYNSRRGRLQSSISQNRTAQ